MHAHARAHLPSSVEFGSSGVFLDEGHTHMHPGYCSQDHTYRAVSFVYVKGAGGRTEGECPCRPPSSVRLQDQLL